MTVIIYSLKGLASRDGQNPSSGAGTPYERSRAPTNHAEEKIDNNPCLASDEKKRRHHTSRETFLRNSVHVELRFIAITLAREEFVEQRRRAAASINDSSMHGPGAHHSAAIELTNGVYKNLLAQLDHRPFDPVKIALRWRIFNDIHACQK